MKKKPPYSPKKTPTEIAEEKFQMFLDSIKTDSEPSLFDDDLRNSIKFLENSFIRKQLPFDVCFQKTTLPFEEPPYSLDDIFLEGANTIEEYFNRNLLQAVEAHLVQSINRLVGIEKAKYLEVQPLLPFTFKDTPFIKAKLRLPSKKKGEFPKEFEEALLNAFYLAIKEDNFNIKAVPYFDSFIQIIEFIESNEEAYIFLVDEFFEGDVSWSSTDFEGSFKSVIASLQTYTELFKSLSDKIKKIVLEGLTNNFRIISKNFVKFKPEINISLEEGVEVEIPEFEIKNPQNVSDLILYFLNSCEDLKEVLHNKMGNTYFTDSSGLRHFLLVSFKEMLTLWKAGHLEDSILRFSGCSKDLEYADAFSIIIEIMVQILIADSIKRTVSSPLIFKRIVDSVYSVF